MKWHFTCGDKILKGKVSAVKENIKTNQPIYFNAPNSYTKYDFSYEPEESWETLIKLELETLREQFSYLRFLYSGGCDSHLILQIILKYNIHIDEIICFKSGIESADFEITNFAEPFLTKNKSQLANTKITIKTHTAQDYINYYNNPDWYKDWLQDDVNGPTFHFRIISQDNKEGSLGTGNVKNNECNILGKEKPLLLFKNNNWYTYFLDTFIEYSPGNNGLYIDNPKIHAKQCHMLLNKIKDTLPEEKYNKSTLGYLDHTQQNFLNESTGRYSFGNNFPLKNLGTNNSYSKFEINKQTFYSYNQKDYLAINEFAKVDFATVQNWARGVQSAYSEIGAWAEKNHLEYGTIGIFSKFYQLNEANNITTIDELFPNGFTL